MNKINVFDKGFFGRTLGASAKKYVGQISSSKLEMSSIDDLNKYFNTKMFAANLDKTPAADCFVPANVVKTSGSRFADVNQFFGL